MLFELASEISNVSSANCVGSSLKKLRGCMVCGEILCLMCV